MLFLEAYILQFKAATDVDRSRLSQRLESTHRSYDVIAGGDPAGAGFDAFVDCYNWLGQPETKKTYDITQNLARNLPGALMQDWLIHLVTSLTRPYEHLEIFTELRISFGSYPLWFDQKVSYARPAEKSDLAVGYLMKGGELIRPTAPWPRKVISALPPETVVLPLATINSKIRVSQSEFFDWVGRESLMTKGNPHCLSMQVALRKEMDINIVEAAQARDKWFLLGTGTETKVSAERSELERLVETIQKHFRQRMGF